MNLEPSDQQLAGIQRRGGEVRGREKTRTHNHSASGGGNRNSSTPSGLFRSSSTPSGLFRSSSRLQLLILNNLNNLQLRRSFLPRLVPTFSFSYPGVCVCACVCVCVRACVCWTGAAPGSLLCVYVCVCVCLTLQRLEKGRALCSACARERAGTTLTHTP